MDAIQTIFPEIGNNGGNHGLPQAVYKQQILKNKSSNTQVCEICGVDSKTDKPNKILMSQFPLDVHRCKKWISATGNPDLIKVPVEELHQLNYVCHQHFAPEDFKENMQLKETAIPTLNVYSSSLSEDMFANFPMHRMTSDHDYCDVIRCEGSDLEDNMTGSDPDIWNSSSEKLEETDESEDEEECTSPNGHTETDDSATDEDLPNDNDSDEDDTSDNENELDNGDIHFAIDDDHHANNTPIEHGPEQSKVGQAIDTLGMDEIDALFLSYAASFKKLSNKLQTMLKLDMAKLFARYEIKNEALDNDRNDPNPQKGSNIFKKPLVPFKTLQPKTKMSSNQTALSKMDNSTIGATRTPGLAMKRSAPSTGVIAKHCTDKHIKKGNQNAPVRALVTQSKFAKIPKSGTKIEDTGCNEDIILSPISSASMTKPSGTNYKRQLSDDKHIEQEKLFNSSSLVES